MTTTCIRCDKPVAGAGNRQWSMCDDCNKKLIGRDKTGGREERK